MPAAVAEFGDLAAMAVLLVAVLAALAIRPLLELLAAAFRVLPLVGGWIADNLVGAAIAGLGGFISWATSTLALLAGFFVRPILWMWSFWRAVVDLGVEAGQGFAHVVRFTIPDAVNAARAEVAGWVDGAYHYAANIWQAAAGYTAQAFAQAESDIRSVFGAALAATAAAEARVMAVIGRAESDLVSLMQTYVGDLVRAINASADQVIAWADDKFASLWGETTALVDGVETTVVGLIDTAMIDLRTELQDAVRAIDGEVASVAAVAAAATAVVAKDLDDYLRRCGNSVCRLTGLADALAGLEGLIGGGLLVALMAEAAHDPRAVADDVVGIVGGIARPAASAVASAAGLAA